MAPSARSYGTAAQVAALARRLANATTGAFDANTNPTLATVESWIDTVSATLNVSLAGVGFSIPIAQEDAKAALASIVVEAVADLAMFANNGGRFFTDQALARGVSPMKVIRSEMAQWVEDQADGLELLGANRTRSSSAGVLSRDSDESGNPTAPIFQRTGFGNDFRDWDGS
jgi:hypothetical protein